MPPTEPQTGLPQNSGRYPIEFQISPDDTVEIYGDLKNIDDARYECSIAWLTSKPYLCEEHPVYLDDKDQELKLKKTISNILTRIAKVMYFDRRKMNQLEEKGGRSGKRIKTRDPKTRMKISMRSSLKEALEEASSEEGVSASLLIQEVLEESPRIARYLSPKP